MIDVWYTKISEMAQTLTVAMGYSPPYPCDWFFSFLLRLNFIIGIMSILNFENIYMIGSAPFYFSYLRALYSYPNVYMVYIYINYKINKLYK